MNLIERITEEMSSDLDNFTAKQSELLTEAYQTADDRGKALLDSAVICLCGWSLKSLLEQTHDDNDHDEVTT